MDPRFMIYDQIFLNSSFQTDKTIPGMTGCGCVRRVLQEDFNLGGYTVDGLYGGEVNEKNVTALKVREESVPSSDPLQ